MKEVSNTPDIGGNAEGFDLLEVSLVLARRWRSIAAWTIGVGAVGLIATLAMKVEYTASVTFTSEPDNSTSTSVFSLQKNDPTSAMLESDSVADLVVDRVQLEKHAYDMKLPVDPARRRQSLRRKVREGTVTTRSAEGVYTLRRPDTDPARGVAIANAYLDAFQDLTDRINFEAASRARVFYKRQMDSEKKDLETAEAALKSEQQRSGVLQPVLGRIEGLRAQVEGLKVQRAQQAPLLTEQNSAMVRLNAEIGELESQISKLQGKSSGNGSDVPSENLELVRLQRDVAYHEALYNTYTAQFERAHLQETFSIARTRVIDRASLPISKTWPKRFLTTLFASLFGFFIGLVVTGIRQIWASLQRDPQSASRLREIRKALSIRGI